MTTPATEGVAAIHSLYKGSLSEFKFHMVSKPSKFNVGDYVYTIFTDHLVGRLKIEALIGDAVNLDSGGPRNPVIVKGPGERLTTPISKQSHRGTRYSDGAECHDVQRTV